MQTQLAGFCEHPTPVQSLAETLIHKYYMIYIDRYWKEIFDPTIACDAPLHRTNQVQATLSFSVPFIP